VIGLIVQDFFCCLGDELLAVFGVGGRHVVLSNGPWYSFGLPRGTAAGQGSPGQ
jgi:hypothetical protein